MKPPKILRHQSDHGTIRLRYRVRSKSLVYEQKDGNQSAVDDGGVSLDSYIHALYGFVLQRPAKKVLMIGCGGGVLGTMLARAGRSVSVVDIDKESFVLAKRYFGLPHTVDCHVGDGLAFMQETRRRFDVVIVDVFVGEEIPPQFTGAEFFATANRCLRATGFVLMNVCLEKKSDRTADKLASGFARCGMSARLLDSPGGERNAIVLAGLVKDLRAPRMLVAPRIDADRIKEEMSEMRFRRRRAAK
jgi:spermidine synthase